MSHKKFLNSSAFLFLDLIVNAASGWLYWLVISKLVSVTEVGQSIAVYSLVLLTCTIGSLGLEYPLLKKSLTERSRIFGSAILIELMITIVVVPLVLYSLKDLESETSQSYIIIALVMIITISQEYVARYALLGISASKTIVVIDATGTLVKFLTGYFLVLSGFGTLAVLLSFMLQTLVTASISLSLAYNKFGFSIGGFKYIRATFIEGIVNMPSIFSSTLIVSLSVVLLASFGITTSEIGVFYIALMVSVVAGSLISSMAYMVIPASSMTQTDLTSASIRIGISLTAPIIAVLLTSPDFVLSLVGTQYVSGKTLLMILAIGILPFALTTNTISRFNYLGMSRRILLIGSLQIIGFVVSFILLVPSLKGVGAALSILISYSVSCIPILIWSEKTVLRYVAKTAIAVIVGWAISSMFRLLLPNIVIIEYITLASCILITAILIFALKNISISEIRTILRTWYSNPTTK
jgi:O-antigen/teichoic acid export membrane protein